MDTSQPEPKMLIPDGISENQNLNVVRWYAHFFDVPFSDIAVLSRLESQPDLRDSEMLIHALSVIGLKCRRYQKSLQSLDPVVLPCVVSELAGNPLIITGIDRKARTLTWVDPDDQNLECSGAINELQEKVLPTIHLVTLEDGARVNSQPSGSSSDLQHWFWKPVRENWPSWAQIMLASLLINTMGLALPLFIMNVYDKVIPNFSFVTLWTLSIGVGLAVFSDLILRSIRSATLVTISRRVDLKVGSALYRHALDIGILDREGGAAQLAGRIREFDSVRDFFTSSSFVSFFDLIFIGIFLGVLYLIVGQLAFVPIIAVPLVLLLALIARYAIDQVADNAVLLATQRQTVLMESLHGIETVKTLNAEPMMQREWESIIAATARTTGRAQFWSSLSINGTAFIQQMMTVVVIVWGVYLVFDKQITVGALIAASILSGRAMAPLSMISQATFRMQYIIKSMRALNEMMQIAPEKSKLIRSSLKVRKGVVRITDLTFTYPDSQVAAINNLSLDVESGEIVALLGRVGSGKTTLGRLLCGLVVQDQGTIQIDGFGLNQYDRSELRHGIGYLPQRLDLFTGTLRENLLLGYPNATQEDIERVLHFSGLASFVAASPEGLNMRIAENGSRLSGGQAQALALARVLLKRPALLFLDEPTNAMDQEMERIVCERLLELNRGGTGLILSTHKQSVANIAERFVILDAGKKILDGNKETVLKRLAENKYAKHRAD